ncbi:MAG: hypothetical protein SV775_04475 [Thermodesulfobacteriota bacterium]|nr:hypothetical protein [Thermodesulfobacteriota bacterium]
MKYLLGLQEYIDENYHVSVFDQATVSGQVWELYLHKHLIIKAQVVKNMKYDLKVKIEGGGDEPLAKTDIKLLYPEGLSESVRPLIKTDMKVRSRQIEPILAPHLRHHIKNKSLFPLMKERQVVFLTLLEGEIVKGVIAGFSRYEITINLKGGIAVTVLRHGVFDLRNKKGRCFLKSFQESHRDWEKSPFFVSAHPPPGNAVGD